MKGPTSLVDLPKNQIRTAGMFSGSNDSGEQNDEGEASAGERRGMGCKGFISR